METMTIPEACKYLGISRITLYRRISAGAIVPIPKNPALKRNPCVKFNRADVERLATG